MFYRGPQQDRSTEINDELFFRFIGYDSVVSVDHPAGAEAYEGAKVGFDLNNIGLAGIVGQNDVVYDVGTLEHIFHTPNVLRNIFESLRVGGWIVHAGVPTNNNVDHGFYQYSPAFFHDYYTVNGFGEISISFTRSYGGAYAGVAAGELLFHDDHASVPYVPGMLDKVSHGGLDSALYSTYFYAKKLADSTCDRIPRWSSRRR